jgi:hypothetical protein
MNLSYIHKLLLAADPFSAIRTNFRGWRTDLTAREGKKKQRKLSRDRHLTCRQREDISTNLQDSVAGPVSMTAAASDHEAVHYEDEIANVLEETGFEVEIDNAKRKSPEQEIPTGVEMAVKDETVQPVHAYRIVRAFRAAGVAIATRINARRRKNDTLYITVGPKGSNALVAPTTSTAATWQSKVRATLLEKWKIKFGVSPLRPKHRPEQINSDPGNLSVPLYRRRTP